MLGRHTTDVTMAWWVGAMASTALSFAGCGPDARMVFAEESVRVSGRAFAEVETSGGEHPSLEAPLRTVAVRLGETERALEVWRDHSGPLAYRTFAPCLRAALVALRAALLAETLPVPSALDEAEALLAEVGGRCGR